jgi:hypothetical protein
MAITFRSAQIADIPEMAVLAALKPPLFFRSRQKCHRRANRASSRMLVGDRLRGRECFQPQAGSADPEREKDVYTIYSLMLTNPRTSPSVDYNERRLTAMNTRPPSVQLSRMRSPKTRKQSSAHVRIGGASWP